MRIYVPSRGRSDRVPAAEELLRSGADVKVVVYPREFETYESILGEGRVVACPEGMTHLGQKEDWIVSSLSTPKDEMVWLVDDDVKRDGGSLLEGIEACDNYARENSLDLVTFGSRFMVNQRLTSEGDWGDSGYMTRCWAVRRSTYAGLDHLMADWEIDMDTVLMLTVRTRGGTYARSNVYTASEYKNRGGGCDTYRTDEMVLESMHRMANLFPDIVTLHEKRVTRHNRVLDLSPRVAWRKLKNPGL